MRRDHFLNRGALVLAGLTMCFVTSTGGAAVNFFVNPDGQVATADPTRDLAFQAALTRPFAEFDFKTYGNQYIHEPSPLFAGVVRVRPNILDVNGADAANLAVNGNRLIETFPFVPAVAGIMGGGAGGAALISRTFAGAGDAIGAAIEFTFSEPVEGFGAWIMDDTAEVNGFVLKITEADGNVVVSPLMDSGNGNTLAIEGFLAATSTVGITKAVIEQQTLAGAASNADYFYVDHVQVGGRFPPETCNNGVDDNADGAVDCQDSECAGNPTCPEICDNGVDDNADGATDCQDSECAAFPACQENCADGIDNDADGLVDCQDGNCGSTAGCAGGAAFFFVNPDGNLQTADPSRDLQFQAALSLPFTEFNLAQFGHEYILEPSPLMAGAVRVRPNLLDASGNNAADLGANGNRLIETWSILPVINGIIGGGADGASLLNRVFTGSGDAVGAAVEITFSEPVEGFGAWIMDDTIEPNQFVLKVTDSTGAVFTSNPLESGNGTALAIEGFIGAVSRAGIVKAVIEQQWLDGTPSAIDFFYVDHLQVGGRFPPEDCTNAVDDNGDGAVDCQDSECTGNAACPEVCTNGTDDNGNGLTDCADPECQNNPAYPDCGETLCADTVDNDGDGQADCDDPNCYGKTGCTVETKCADGIDNDADGLTDCQDADCTDDAACPEVCDDDADNDGDGLVDCQDPECSAAANCPEICNDFLDNNADGLVDCADPQCSALPACSVAPTFFVEPDGNLGEAVDETLDQAFQAGLTLPFAEFDFSTFGNEYILDPTSFFVGPVNVRPNLLDVNGNNAADLNANGARLVETYPRIPFIPEVMGGGADGAALLNRTYAGGGRDVIAAATEFTFSLPVEGFGAWIMDDTVEASRFVLKVTETDGKVYTSPPLESGNGTSLAIEGFIGAVSKVGIVRAVIEQQKLNSAPSNADFYYLDHVQVGSRFPGCNDPFADFDHDGDVDQEDFGAFQICFTGPGGTTSDACRCNDRDEDSDVDVDDLQAFEACASGPSLPASAECDGQPE